MAEAAVTPKGQITTPVEIRRQMNGTTRQSCIYPAAKRNDHDAREEPLSEIVGRLRFDLEKKTFCNQ